MFTSEDQAKFGDFTFASGAECLASHVETVTETSRRGQWHFMCVPKKWQNALRLGTVSLHFISQ